MRQRRTGRLFKLHAGAPFVKREHKTLSRAWAWGQSARCKGDTSFAADWRQVLLSRALGFVAQRLPLGFLGAQPFGSSGLLRQRFPSFLRTLAALTHVGERRRLPLDPRLLGTGEKEVEVRVPKHWTCHDYSVA